MSPCPQGGGATASPGGGLQTLEGALSGDTHRSR